jgi:hypothetical protein
MLHTDRATTEQEGKRKYVSPLDLNPERNAVLLAVEGVALWFS